MKHQLDFYTDFGQFYLSDKDAPGDTGSEDFWTDGAHNEMLAVEDGVLGVSIKNDEGIVKCELEFLETKSEILDFSEYDHVVEASIIIKSGILQILDCPHSHVELEKTVEIGEYRVRVYSNNLKTAYDENPEDNYKIEIWKAPYSQRVVVKQFVSIW
jgi:hypothetical protein